jgi:hypothetical protein
MPKLKLVEPAIQELGRPKPRMEIRARLDFLETLVRAAGVSGVPYAEACRALELHLNQKITVSTLKHTVRQWNYFSNLVMRGRKLQLQSHIVVEILAQQRRSQFLQMALVEEEKEETDADLASRSARASYNF